MQPHPLTPGELFANVYELVLSSRYFKSRCAVRNILVMLTAEPQAQSNDGMGRQVQVVDEEYAII